MYDAVGTGLSFVDLLLRVYNRFRKERPKLELTDVKGCHWIDKYKYTHFDVSFVLRNKGDRDTTLDKEELVIFPSQPEKSETIPANYIPSTDLKIAVGDSKTLIFSFLLQQRLEDERIPVRLSLRHTYNKLMYDLESRFTAVGS